MVSIDTVMFNVSRLLAGLSVIAMVVGVSFSVFISIALFLLIVAGGIALIGFCGGFREWDRKRQ